MRKIELGSEVFIGIQGYEVPIVKFGLAGGFALTSPKHDEIIAGLVSAEETLGPPDFWQDQEVAEVLFDVDSVATCGLALASWLLERPIDPRLNRQSIEYARLDKAHLIASTAENAIMQMSAEFRGSMAYHHFVQSRLTIWSHSSS